MVTRQLVGVAGPDFWRLWRGPESNRRHHGFQPCALPTELPRRGARSVALIRPKPPGDRRKRHPYNVASLKPIEVVMASAQPGRTSIGPKSARSLRPRRAGPDFGRRAFGPVLPRRERPVARHPKRPPAAWQETPSRGRRRTPRTPRSHAGQARPAPARTERRSASTGPTRTRRAPLRPGATSRPSSSKNGIMFASETSSNVPSPNASADASPRSNRRRPASSGGILRRASEIIPSERSTPTTSACGKCRASANAAAPVPVPRSSTRAGGIDTASRASSNAARCVGARIVSHTGASPSNCRSIGPRNSLHRRGRPTVALVATRANFRPRRMPS